MLLVLSALAFICGVAVLFGELYPVPTTLSMKAVSAVQVNYSQRYEGFLEMVSSFMIRFFRMSEHKREEYTRILNALNVPYSAEKYVVRLIVKSSIYLLIFAMLIPFTPTAIFIGAIVSLFIYWSEIKKLKENYKQRIVAIEMELPKLCSVINSRLKSTTNTSVILKSFVPIADQIIAGEIRITINEMETGNAENALKNLERRVSSPKMSDVVRGLISIQNGDDQSVYFQSKQHQFNNDYQTLKRKQISQRPLKMSLPGLILVGFFMMILIYPLAISMSDIMTNIF